MTVFYSQRKKVDTVYVYEKVIVYDTIYLEKAVQLKKNDFILPILKIEAVQINVLKNNFDEEKLVKKINRRSQYGIEAGIGLKNVSWSENISGRNQFGQNFGIWISKNIFRQLFLMLSANIHHWNSTLDLDTNKEETYLDGFYFSENNDPLFFQRFNNKHFEYVFRLKFIYEWKNVRPFIGFSANRNAYKMQFLVPENGVLNKLDDFRSSQTNFGFSLGLQYRIFSRFLINLEYERFKVDNVSLKNSSFDFDIFKTNNTFAERKINLGISYFISK